MDPKKLYSIIDIETTGGRSNQHKITEIAMIKFDGVEIIDEFKTLINPERNIPYSITQLTGISNEMVLGAPKFYQVAKKIVEFTEGTIFVAHNVYFDYNIIRREFSELGYAYKKPHLCTVKLARKFIPGLESYSLGNLCRDLGIELKNRHRAYGDASATVELFKLILSKELNSENIIEIDKSSQICLPAGLNHSDIDELPEGIGVYQFINNKGEIIYIGKSVNIQKRVKSHLSSKLKRSKDFQIKSSIAKINTIELPHEWASLIVEADLIKKHRPIYNRALNSIKFKYGLRKVFENNYLQLKVTTRQQEIENTAFMYRSKKTAISAINRFYFEAFGFEADSVEHEKYLNTIPANFYNQQLIKILNNREYPSGEFDLYLPANKKDKIKFEFRAGRLVKIAWKEHSFCIEEDPDIKRLVLRKLHLYKSYITHVINGSTFETEFA
jgi:DNA polymerase-3 subunit epsilon